MKDKYADQLLEEMVDRYASPLLSWAYRKTGSSLEAQDLSQEVLLQVTAAVRRETDRGRAVEQPEHLLWKVAHYVWCRRCRREKTSVGCLPLDETLLPDPEDFAASLADDEETRQRLSRLRERLSRLDGTRREVMIAHYLENEPVKALAQRLAFSESQIKWILFDTRKRLKKELTQMEPSAYVYRPHTLSMAQSGRPVPSSDIRYIQDSLARQNICIACYREALTPEELSRKLGLPRPYVDADLKLLEEKEFVSVSRGRYSTAFPLFDCAYEDGLHRLYAAYFPQLSDPLAEGLLTAEKEIRAIGFHGSDKPMSQLLWWLIYLFDEYLLPSLLPEEKPALPLRPDGGQYLPVGTDPTEPPGFVPSLDLSDWGCNGVVRRGGFRWYGLYNFAQTGLAGLAFGFYPEEEGLRRLLLRCVKEPVHPGGLEEEERYQLSRLVQRGLILLREDTAVPDFCVLTPEQFDRLIQMVFDPLAARLGGTLNDLTQDVRVYCRDKVPPQLRSFAGFFIQSALAKRGSLDTLRAFRRGLLTVPEDSRAGERLTLIYAE